MRKKLIAGMLVVMFVAGMMPGKLMNRIRIGNEVEAAATLQNPIIEPDDTMEAGQKVTYDCVWFGTYPQTEIVDKASTCGTYGEVWGLNSDYEVNPELFTNLQNADGWNDNGDITISGIKYRRWSCNLPCFIP